MSIDSTPRSLVLPLVLFGATLTLACSGRNALGTLGPVDAGHDRPPEVLGTPDSLAPAERPSDLPNLPIEASYPPACPIETACLVVCSDRRLESGEQCDDGNITSGDGCSNDCSVEPGWRCPWIGQRCIPICGDRLLNGGETCDDGNTVSGDGCSITCLTEPGWDCTSGICELASAGDGGQLVDGVFLYCGDGIISGAEECDDGPLNSDTVYGGCSRECMRIDCGDGVVNGPEECDLGPGNAATYGDVGGCTSGCTRAHYCGDGVVDAAYGEMCDFGAANGTFDVNCDLNCILWGIF